jgi:hypothetical protein
MLVQPPDKIGAVHGFTVSGLRKIANTRHRLVRAFDILLPAGQHKEDAMNLETGLLVAILVFVFLSLFARGGGNVAARLRPIDRKLDLVLAKLGIDPYEGIDKRLVELVRGGQKLEAIKLYREQIGCGLKEAKDYVEGL